MKTKIKRFEIEVLQTYSNLLELIVKDQEFVEENWPKTVFAFENLLAIARTIEYQIFMRQVKHVSEIRKLPPDIQNLIVGK